METLSELQRENRELNDRKELLELRQENRNLKNQIERLESGKMRGPFVERVKLSLLFFAVTIGAICGGIILGDVVLSLKAIAGIG